LLELAVSRELVSNTASLMLCMYSDSSDVWVLRYDSELAASNVYLVRRSDVNSLIFSPGSSVVV